MEAPDVGSQTDMISFPVDDLLLRAFTHQTLALERGAAGAQHGRSPWAETAKLVASYSFSFASQKKLPFDPPLLGSCPSVGTPLPLGVPKPPMLFRSVWAKEEAGMRALAEAAGSGIVEKEVGREDDPRVAFAGNVACLLGEKPHLDVVVQLLRVNNIVYLSSRRTDGKQHRWTAGNALEELWTTNRHGAKSSYVFFRGKIGDNVVFFPSQVDAVRTAGSTELAELKLLNRGEIREEHKYATFVQCHFKLLQSVLYVNEAPFCKLYEQGRCERGSKCHYMHEEKKTGRSHGSIRVMQPANFNRDMVTLDRLLTRLATELEPDVPSVLVWDGERELTLYSHFAQPSPYQAWLEVPDLFRSVCYCPQQ
jgi:hypothetical protein